MRHGEAGQTARAGEPFVPGEIFSGQSHRRGVRGRVVDVGGIVLVQRAAEPAAHCFEPGRPLRALVGREKAAVMGERFAKRNGGENGDSLPVGVAVVVDAALVGEHVLLPRKELPCGGKVFFLARRVRQIHHRVNRVRAAAMNDVAGGAENAAVQLLYARIPNLQLDQPVAPAFQQRKIQIVHFSILPFSRDEAYTEIIS